MPTQGRKTRALQLEGPFEAWFQAVALSLKGAAITLTKSVEKAEQWCCLLVTMTVASDKSMAGRHKC